MSGRVRPQIGIRNLMLGVLFVSIPLGLIGWRMRVAWIEHRAIESARGKVAMWGGAFDKGLVDGDFYIALQDREITDQQLIELAQDLQRFPGPWLDQRHTIVLDVSGNPITDDAVPHLADVSFLSLNLANTKITDRAVPSLEGLSLLSRLNIANTQISKSGIHRLRRALGSRNLVCEDR